MFSPTDISAAAAIADVSDEILGHVPVEDHVTAVTEKLETERCAAFRSTKTNAWPLSRNNRGDVEGAARG